MYRKREEIDQRVGGRDVNQVTTLQGRYRLGREIAAGGMGVVYTATDERLERPVAVKRPHESLVDDESFLRRFTREAHAVAALSHPNIAAVFDYGEEGGSPFIVMELLRGQDLAMILSGEGALDQQRALGIGAQVCAALAHAHAAGVVHRDVKPANVFVEESDRVKVTDFGIARATGDMTITGTGAVFGTASYISPEQAAGGNATAQSDLYSLGIVLYEMLTGRLPFDADSPIAMAMSHVHDEISAPSESKPGIRAEVDEVVARATAKVPGNRYSTATEMLEALQGCMQPSSETPKRPAGVAAAPSLRTTTPLRPGATTPLDRRPGLPVSVPSNWRVWLAGAAVIVALLLLLLLGPSSDPDPSPSDRAPAGEREPDTDSRIPDPLEKAIDRLEEAIRR